MDELPTERPDPRRARYESGLVGATLVRDGHVADGIEGAVDNIRNRPTVAGGTIE